MKKLMDTLMFYYSKLVKIVDAACDTIVKTVEVTLAKVPQLISDAYDLIKNNITVQNGIAFILVYVLYENFNLLIKTPIVLISVLVAIAVITDKLKFK